MKVTNLVLIGLLIGAAFLFYKSMVKNEDWSLSVCKTKWGSECEENSYVIPGYKSQNECMTAGMNLAKKEGFECGRNCRDEYGLRICEYICNESGCQD